MRPPTTETLKLLKEVVAAGPEGLTVAARRAGSMIALEKRGLAQGTPSTCPSRNADKTYLVKATEEGYRLAHGEPGNALFRRMSEADRLKCLDLSRRCKTGYVPTREEMAYLERMFTTYPEDYRAVGEEVRQWANRLMNPLATPEE